MANAKISDITPFTPPIDGGDLLEIERAGASFRATAADIVAAAHVGRVIGADIQAYSANLTTFAGIAPSANVQTLLAAADYAAMRTDLGLVIGTNVQAYGANLTTFSGIAPSANVQTMLAAANNAAIRAAIGAGTGSGDLLAANNLSDVGNAATAGANLRPVESLIIALGDETTAITTGVAKVTMRTPYAFTLTAVRASLTTASSSGLPTVDINEGGVSILSTKLTIDANELTSTTAAAAAVISDATLADDAEITFDIDVAGTGAKGLKVYLIGHRT